MEHWEGSWALLMKALVGTTFQNSSRRLGWLGVVRPHSQNVNTNSYPNATMYAGSEVGGILRGLSKGEMQIRDYPSRNNSVLNRSENDTKNDSKKTIPKAKNSFEYKYNQGKCLSIIIRCYIANNSKTEVKHRGSNYWCLKQRSKATEIGGLAPAGVHLRGWWTKINGKRYPFYIW